MVATVRLDGELEMVLNRVSKMLSKKKSDVIRDAITYYAHDMEKNNQSRLLNAIEKTKKADKIEHEALEGTITDGL